MSTSGSMMGDRMKLARDSLKYCVQKLNPRDEFNVVRFSTDVEALFEKPQVASEGNVKKALDFVGNLEAIGGTAIDEAMTRALKDGEGRGERPHMVMFITDGHPTVGETDEAAIAAERAEIASRSAQRIIEKESALFRCPHCGARRCSYIEVQRRSLDEAPDYICKCLACNHKVTGRQ